MLNLCRYILTEKRSSFTARSLLEQFAFTVYLSMCRSFCFLKRASMCFMRWNKL